MIDALAQEPLLANLYGQLEVDHKDLGRALVDATDLPPDEALEWFRSKKIVTDTQFKKLSQAQKQRAFAIAGQSNMRVLQRAHEIIAESIRDGVPQKKATDALRQSIPNLAPLHAEVVFRTQVQSSYMAGRYQQMSKHTKRRPYWRYLTVGDDRVRPAHAAMNGRVYAADDPIWATWFPSNGFSCRCSIETLSQR